MTRWFLITATIILLIVYINPNLLV